MGIDSPVHYARAAGVSLAYQTWGAGPVRIVGIPPMVQNIELMWERPEYRYMLDRFGSFAHCVHFDKRGTGASDRTAVMPTMDERVEDVRTVMDAAGMDTAHLVGVSEGGPAALVFTATYPERVEGVVLVSSGARLVDDTEVDGPDRRELVELFIDRWGSAESITLDLFAPTAAADDGYRAWEPRYERQSASQSRRRNHRPAEHRHDRRVVQRIGSEPIGHREDLERTNHIQPQPPGKRHDHDGAWISSRR